MGAALVGEALGTFVMVLLGTGAVACAVLTGALQGLWQVAVVWAIGVTVAIYVAAPLSGAHLNPAVTLAFTVFRSFPPGRLPAYWLAQLTGAVLAGGVVLLVFGPMLARFEQREGLVRGAPGSERAAMIFGEYFPNPAIFGTGPEAAALVSPIGAMAVEALGTAILLLVIFAVTDPRHPLHRYAPAIPPIIGLTVGALICVFAPLTQAGWNPARDFGPRLIAYLAGYGSVAIPGPQNGFWIYLVGPLVGALAGGLLYERLVAPHLRASHPEPARQPQSRALLATARLEGKMAKEHAVVLFLCVHNAGRSQMAAAFTRQLGEGRIEVRSAGSTPASEINPTVIQAMQEVGIDLAQEYPKPIADEVVREADVVVTMGCGDACPVYPGKRYEDWELDDPAGQPLGKVREIRDAIRGQVEKLVAELAVTA
jgi:glycerol uptake facilitator protein